jgi:hypothetical protein
MPRLEGIRTNLIDRLQEAKVQGWPGELAALEATIAAPAQKLDAMRMLATQHSITILERHGDRSKIISVKHASDVHYSGQAPPNGHDLKRSTTTCKPASPKPSARDGRARSKDCKSASTLARALGIGVSDEGHPPVRVPNWPHILPSLRA